MKFPFLKLSHFDQSRVFPDLTTNSFTKKSLFIVLTPALAAINLKGFPKIEKSRMWEHKQIHFCKKLSVFYPSAEEMEIICPFLSALVSASFCLLAFVFRVSMTLSLSL